MNLQVKSIKSVKIYGKETGDKSVAWIDYLTLIDDVENLQNDFSNFGNNYQENRKTSTELWPAWIPYPCSWFRAFILITFIAFIAIVIFRITGFWGFILSSTTNHLEILVLFVGLGILLPMFLVAYLHSFFMSLWKKQSTLPYWPRWFPNANSLWEGFYSQMVMLLSFLMTIVIILPFLPLRKCQYQEILTYCSVINEAVFDEYVEKYYFDKIAVSIWIVTAAYLYQAEYLFRQRFIPKVKSILKKYQSKPQSYNTNNTDLAIDRLRGDMGITQMRKGKKQQSQITSLSQHHNQKPKKLSKQLLILFLISLVTTGIYLFFKIQEIKENIPLSITSTTQTPLPSKAAAVIPSSVTSDLYNLTPKLDNFREAVNQAIGAANLTQSAKSQDDWKLVVSKWQAAIALMKVVPSSSPNYVISQQKAIEYQRNLSYAQKNAEGRK
ncbi:hypothetical protein [aff. Roholtiella sp. LEGE 12411]|uniref:hypothetical protein n=1 Tax=aff. Roholtiella sp. LEGE 12411 TaxID=1828822 RepID=UPI001880B7B1|nr:hypothetical protein [aff. Roholtiella sp. LEGE 12411]MBE9038037.1 hypothetical protein [aff. Roholtiella sp. LEGE 12411]